MPDTLTTGAVRLGKRFWGLDAQHTCADVIAADPGVKAQHAFVLHFAELDCCCEQMERLLRDLAGPDSPPFKCYSCLARIVIKKWEDGG